MRLRMKLRLGLAVLLGVVFIILVVYLFAIPRLPTGYDEIARLRQADLQAENVAAPVAPVSAASRRPVPPSPSALAESPRQKFQRCWAAVMNYGETHWSPAHKKAYGGFDSLTVYVPRDAALPPAQVTVLLLPQEWSAISRLPGDSPAYRQALRCVVEQRLDLKYILAPLQLTSGSQPSAPATPVANLTGLIDTPPFPEAVELLTLPDDAIPALSPPPDKTDYEGRPTPIIFQAYLFELAHNPAFDAAAGLRRMYELQHFRQMELYPSPLFGEDPILMGMLPWILESSGLLNNAHRVALAAELARLQREDRQWAATITDKVRRYQAECVYNDLSREFERALQGRSSSGNFFHYLMDGKIERLWMRANKANVRRHIELYAVAVAKGNDKEKQAAHKSMLNVLNLINIHSSVAREFPRRNSFSSAPVGGPLPDLTCDVAWLALKAYWLDHHQLPGDLAELTPAYLPLSALQDPQTILWITKIGGQTGLVQATLVDLPLPDVLRKSAQDPEKFRQFILQAGVAGSPQLTDEQIEEVRRDLLDRQVAHFIKVAGGPPLNFEMGQTK